MLTMQNLSRPAGVPVAARPLCPNCGRSMHIVPVEPQPDSLTDVRIYRCGECGVSLAEAGNDRSALSRMRA